VVSRCCLKKIKPCRHPGEEDVVDFSDIDFFPDRIFVMHPFYVFAAGILYFSSTKGQT
jgi:hypothetical protein